MQAGIHKHLPVGFTETVFGELFPKPLCELFQPSTAPGFVGHCLLNNMSRTCQGGVSTPVTCPALLFHSLPLPVQPRDPCSRNGSAEVPFGGREGDHRIQEGSRRLHRHGEASRRHFFTGSFSKSIASLVGGGREELFQRARLELTTSVFLSIERVTGLFIKPAQSNLVAFGVGCEITLPLLC